MQKKINGITVTDDLDLLNEEHEITPDMQDILSECYEYAIEGQKSKISKLEAVIEKYPKTPQFKNYLSVLYTQAGEKEKANEVNKRIVQEHPNYLFGKLMLAGEYFTQGNYDKIPELLGDELDLQNLYPNRDVFHINELSGFLKCKALYFIGKENMETAEALLDDLINIDPESTDTQTVQTNIWKKNMELSMKRQEEESRNKIKVENNAELSKEIISEAPVFNHVEINWLYESGLYIGDEKLKTIISLPRKTVIADLELVLKDSITRFAYFNEKCEKDGWKEEAFNFVIHAIFLLGELEATESIEAVFEILSQPDEYNDLYIGDFLTDCFWEPLYKIANNNLEACKQFMFRPAVDTYSKSELSQMAAQVAFHHPERREEVIDWFVDVFTHYKNTDEDSNIVDSDLLGLMICEIIHLKAIEVMPLLHELAEAHYISYGICGTLDKVENAINRPARIDYKADLLSISDRYKKITTTGSGYNEDKSSSSFFDDYSLPKQEPVRTEPKVGRNDPCPCGSGKKYKKCCLK